MSTIGVNGNSSGSKVFTELDNPAPHNPYSISKLEAEISLKEISVNSGMEMVIVRAPLVYGPGNPGNFLSLLRIVDKGFPLPFASVNNRKSFLFVENLADALAECSTHPLAAGQTFLVSDGQDVSTPKLIQQLATALDRPTRLFRISPKLMQLVGKMIGKSTAVDRLLGSLVVDSGKIRRDLGWHPPYTMTQGLAKTAEWYCNSCR
jgi:nucleoside-diphosphate-sugar epimerase